MARQEESSFFRSPMLWGGCGCCLGCILIPLVLATVAGGGVFWAVRQSGIQQEVLDRVREDPRVVERLGEPIETGWMVEGSINLNTGGGTADYSVPLNGSKASGRVHVVADRVDGVWVYRELYVDIDGERIHLVDPANPQPLPADEEGTADGVLAWSWPAPVEWAA